MSTRFWTAGPRWWVIAQRRPSRGVTSRVLRPGSVFAHYELEAVAGSGGMGVVYRARDLRLGRRVALKIIAPHLARQPLVRERLNREATAPAAVDHPNPRAPPG